MAAEFDEYEYLEKQLEGRGRDKENGRGHRSDRDRGSRSHRSSGGDREKRKRDHSRSRSRERRHRHDRSREEPPRRQQRPASPPPKRVREKTPPEVKEQRERERELKELDRDTRTVFAYNLNLKAEERNLFEFFSKAGKVVDVKIIMDRNTRKSKGFSYIEFQNREDIVNALALTGQVLLGQAVMVKSSEAEKNLAWEAAQQQSNAMAQMNAMAGMGAGTGPCKLAVNNLHPNITEPDLMKIFEPFGHIDAVNLQKDATGRSQGYGFVQFTSMADATKAMQQLHGLDIGGTAISVKIAAIAPTDMAGLAGMNMPTLDDDEDEYGGMKLSSQARAALMNRLAGQGPPPGASAAGSDQGMVYEQGILGPSSPIATPCLLLKNMFDPATETEPGWEQDIAEDVKDECQKYGAVVHAFVDRSSRGFVYLKFANIEGAKAAQKALHGRWFASRQIVADFQFAPTYSSHFGC
ncbi:hypothetical protein WJX84_001809 [Apatococcus fuscideae]|uniref:RRM domain-containing protein n=1 Tax=Apatococcus fuscideae TaxID=2026836 RepID=A0AAW1T8Q2_9CHLO